MGQPHILTNITGRAPNNGCFEIQTSDTGPLVFPFAFLKTPFLPLKVMACKKSQCSRFCHPAEGRDPVISDTSGLRPSPGVAGFVTSLYHQFLRAMHAMINTSYSDHPNAVRPTRAEEKKLVNVVAKKIYGQTKQAIIHEVVTAHNLR